MRASERLPAGSGRRGVPGLVSPHPIGATLPGLYQDDDLAQRFCAALDEVLAPVLATVDCLPAYLDPALAPPDVLDWLAGWVGLADAVFWPVQRRRALVARAAELHAWRGTPYAVRKLVRLATGLIPEIEDPGGTIWSHEPRSAPPPPGPPELVIRVRVPADPPDDVYSPQSESDRTLLTALVRLVAPAHLPWRVEVVTGG